MIAQYDICSADDGFHGDRLRALPDPIPAKNGVIPDPDSIPLNVLNHPIGDKHEVDFAAYDPLVVSLSVGGSDAV